MFFVWIITIPVWFYMIILAFGAAIWEKFGAGIFFIINLFLTALCFISIPAFLGNIWILIRKIGGHDDEITYKEIFEGLIGTGIWAFIGVGYYGNLIFG